MRQRAVLGALQSMVDDLAERLTRSVVVDDPDVVIICSSRHFGDEDPVRIHAVLQRAVDPEVAQFVLAHHPGGWPRAGMLPASAELGLKPRLCVPLREQGVLLGLLMVIDADHTLRLDEIELIEHSAARMSALMYADHVAADATRLRLRLLIGDLLSNEPERRLVARRRLVDDGVLRDGPAVVTVIEAAGSADDDGSLRVVVAEAAASAATTSSGHGVAAVLDDLTHVVQVHPRPPARGTLRPHAQRLATAVARRLASPADLRVGVGGAQADLADAWRSAQQARIALRAVQRMARLDGFGIWSDLGELALLVQLEPSALDQAPILEPISRLVAGDPSGRLCETLVTYLDQAGSIPRTAASLHLHRTSLYYRLNQITQLIGVDLDDGAERLRLHLALRLVELGTSPTRSAP